MGVCIQGKVPPVVGIQYRASWYQASTKPADAPGRHAAPNWWPPNATRLTCRVLSLHRMAAPHPAYRAVHAANG